MMCGVTGFWPIIFFVLCARLCDFYCALRLSLCTMATSESFDASETDNSEAGESAFCSIHVIDTQSKIIPFSDKSYQKCKECAAKWVIVEESLESEVAEKLQEHVHESEGVGQVGLQSSTTSREHHTRLRGYHAECYRHFCNVTTISRALTRLQKKRDAEKTSTEDPEEVSASEDAPAPKRLLRSRVSHENQPSTSHDFDKPHVLPVHCIICKGAKYIREQSSGKRKVEKLILCERKDGGHLLEAALLKQDEQLLLHIRGKDLVAIEVRYHKSCYYRYTKVVKRCNTYKQDTQQTVIYDKSYSSFCKKVIEERIMNHFEYIVIYSICEVNVYTSSKMFLMPKSSSGLLTALHIQLFMVHSHLDKHNMNPLLPCFTQVYMYM
eukprot:XP_011677284.1 PREDICTED: uncharacterized protein LOC762622 [Strongylocentrotus purpuratus]